MEDDLFSDLLESAHEMVSNEKVLQDRAETPESIGSGFSKEMTKEYILNGLKLARQEAKDFHNKFSTGELLNPAVGIEESRLRTKGKLKDKN